MKKKLVNRSSANFLYDYFTVPEKLHKYHNYSLTEGINELSINENCFWLIDIICHHKINFDIEVWKFSREKGNIFLLTGINMQDIKFVEFSNLESDFYFDDLTILKKRKLLCLPIEADIY